MTNYIKLIVYTVILISFMIVNWICLIVLLNHGNADSIYIPHIQIEILNTCR